MDSPLEVRAQRVRAGVELFPQRVKGFGIPPGRICQGDGGVAPEFFGAVGAKQVEQGRESFEAAEPAMGLVVLWLVPGSWVRPPR